MSRIAVIGLGKLGAPLAVCLSKVGHHVIGLDLNAQTVKNVNIRLAPVPETDLDTMIMAHPFPATQSNEELVKASDTAFIIVPTPSVADGSFTNEYVLDAVKALGEALRGRKRYYNVVICSTVMPGSTGGVIRKALEEASGRRVGINLGLCYSPEFIALGSVIHDIQNPDMVLIGQSDDKAGVKLAKIMRSLSSAPIRRMSLMNAEISKISVNAYVTMKISFANTLAEICESVDTGDAHEVANAIGLDARIGRKYLSPGTAFGGPCFPRDNRAFSRLAENLGVSADLARATDVVNLRQTQRLADYLDMYPGVVGILGVAYKPETSVTEESPGAALAQELIERGREVRVQDPAIRNKKFDLPNGETIPMFITTGDILNFSKLVVIMTPDKTYGNLVPKCFEEHHDLIVFDCWDVTPRGPWDDLNVIRIGREV